MNQYNYEQLIELINKAKGERSMRQYALEAGLNPATLNLIVKGKRKANANHILSLTSNSAAPRNGVSFSEMSEAAGIAELTIDLEDDVVIISDENNSHIFQKELEVLAIGVIQKSMMSQNVKFISTDSRSNMYSPDFSVQLIDVDNQEIWYEIKSFLTVESKDLQKKIMNVLSKILFVSPDVKRKIVIIVDTKQAYKKFVDMKGKFSFKGNLSVAYLDREKLVIGKEMIISEYN